MPIKPFFTLLLLLLSFTAGAQKAMVAPVVSNGYLCVIDTSGRIITDSIFRMDEDNLRQAVYNRDGFFSDGVFRLEQQRRVGFRNYTGRLIAPCIFDHARPFKNGFAAVFSNHKWGSINKRGKYIADTIYDHVSDANSDGIMVLRKGESIAVIDSSGKFIVPFYYKTDVRLFPEPEFSDGLLRVMVRDTFTVKETNAPAKTDIRELQWKIGFINKTGKLVIDTAYRLDAKNALQNSLQEYSELMRRRGGRPMCSNDRGYRGEITWHLYGDYYKFDGNRCLVLQNDTPAVINEKGEIVFGFGAYGTKIKNQKGYFIRDCESYDGRGQPYVYNRSGKLIIRPEQCDKVTMVGEDIFEVTKARIPMNDQINLTPIEIFDTTGQSRFEYYVEGGYSFDYTKNGTTAGQLSKQSKELVYINTKGQSIPDEKGELDIIEKSGLRGWVARRSKKWGYLDSNFKWMLPPAFEEAMAFSNDLAPVKMNSKWGYINKNGKLIIPCRYDMALNFQVVEEW